MNRARRRSAAAGLAILTAVAGAGPAWAAEQVPPGRDTSQFACPPSRVPAGRFDDTANNTFKDEINCLAWYGITVGGPGGRPPSQYAPGLAVSRDQMATFIARFLDYVDETLLPAYDGVNRFRDVPDDSVHVSGINRLAQAGIAHGGAGGAPSDTYSPELPVARDQMASFIARAAGVVLEATLCVDVTDYFDDDGGNVHERCINGLADTGIVQGTGFATYNPNGSITRGQMSAFLMRSMDLFVEQTLASPPPAP